MGYNTYDYIKCCKCRDYKKIKDIKHVRINGIFYDKIICEDCVKNHNNRIKIIDILRDWCNIWWMVIKFSFILFKLSYPLLDHYYHFFFSSIKICFTIYIYRDPGKKEHQPERFWGLLNRSDSWLYTIAKQKSKGKGNRSDNISEIERGIPRMKEEKLFNVMECPACGYKKEIRKDYQTEPDGSILVYYRCKDCAYMWD